MGFNNLKEVLAYLEQSKLKQVVTRNIEKDLTTTIECLRFDTIKQLYISYVLLSKQIFLKYCNQEEEIDLASFIKVLKDLKVIPKIISIQHAYILFTKLIPVHSNNEYKEGADDKLGSRLYCCKRLIIDHHLFVHALFSIAISIEYPHVDVQISDKIGFFLELVQTRFLKKDVKWQF